MFGVRARSLCFKVRPSSGGVEPQGFLIVEAESEDCHPIGQVGRVSPEQAVWFRLASREINDVAVRGVDQLIWATSKT